MKRILSLLVAMIMALSCVGITAMAEDAAVTTISTVAELEAFRDSVNKGKTYEGETVTLAAELNLSSVADWTPIGTGTRSGTSYTSNAFKGTFDGAGNTISGLSILSTTGDDAAIGLFGVVDGGTVKNLKLTDVNINVATSDLAGGAIGMMLNNAIADNITVSGSVTGNDGVGGVVGRMIISGTISNCTNNASVTSSYGGIGGVVGKAYYEDSSDTSVFGTISGCTNNGTITAPMYIGGIVGLARCNVTGCTNNGAVVGGAQTGGVIGQLIAAGAVSGNVNNAKISGINHMGGIIGDYTQSKAYTYYNVSITDNINRGELAATEQCAAIMGCNNIDGFTNMTASGNVSYYNADGLELFGNPEDMVIDNTNKFEIAVALVGNTTYSSVADALAAAAETGAAEVKILQSVRELLEDDLFVTIKSDLTITADSAVTVDFYNNGTGYDLILDGTNGEALTIAENVTLTVSDRIIWIGYGGNNIDVIVNGSLIGGYQLWFGGDVTVSDTGTVGSKGEALVGRRGATLAINGGNLEANYFSLISGTVELNNATATTGPLWLSSNSEGAGEIILINSSLTSSGNLKMSGGASVTVTDGSTLSLTSNEYGDSVIGEGCTLTIDTSSSVTANAITGAGAINIDASDFNGTEIPVLNTAGMSGFTGNVSVVNSSGADYEISEDGSITVIEKAVENVAEVNGVEYETLEAAFKAATDGCTIDILSDVTITEPWDCRYNGAKITVPVTIDGNGKTLKLTGVVDDKNWNTVFRFEADATVKNLTIDVSEATGVQRGISSKLSITAENCKFIGNGSSSKRAIIFGEGAGDALSNVTATITGCTFTNWTLGVSDNQSGKDAKSVTIADSEFSNASVLVSASETVTFIGNTVANGYVNVKSYTADNTCNVTAIDNTLDLTKGEDNKIDAGGTVNAQEGFTLPKPTPAGDLVIAYYTANYNNKGVHGIYGQAEGVVGTESFKVELYSGNELVGTAELANEGKVLLDGKAKSISWHILLGEDSDTCWKTEWIGGAMKANKLPDNAKLYVDGQEVSTCNVVLNSADDSYPILAVVSDEGGAVHSFIAANGYVNNLRDVAEKLSAGLAAANEGDTVTLVSDVALEKSIGFTKDITLTIDGAGFSIKPAQGSTETNSAFNFGQGSNATVENRNYTIKNIVFDGWTTDHVLRLQGVNATVENCKFINCNQPDGLGLLTLTYCKSTVEDCVFENNTCVKAIDVNSNANADATNATEIKNCTFNNNNCIGAAGVIEAYEGSFIIKDSEFVDNTAVSASIFCATDATISGNYFAENTYTGTKGNEASVLAGPWVEGNYEITINNNAFKDASEPGAYVEQFDAYPNAVTTYNLNGNYWNGGEPNYDTTGNPTVTLENYYTEYTDGVLDGLVEIAKPVAKIGDTTYPTFAGALEVVQDGQTITLLDATGDESKTEIEFDKAISFTITGDAPNYALPIVTFKNAIVTIKDAEILTPELDARQNATINVVDSTVYDAGGNSIVKSYYNGAINISGTSVVYTMQVTTMGYITISDTAKLNATWQTNVYGNGMITVEDEAKLVTAALQLTGQDYSGRDNTDTDRVGKPATIVVNGATLTVGKVLSHNGADYSYNSSYGINIGTLEDKSAVLDVKNGATVNIYMADGQTANIGTNGTVNVDGSALNVACRATDGTVTLTNNGTVNISGTSDIAAKVTGAGWVYMNGVTLDADTKLIGAKVRFASGTNNIDGSVIDDGFFQVGIGAYNGVDANVDTVNGVTVNVKKNAKIGSNGETYAGWIGTGFYDTDAEKAKVMTDAKYVLNIENSIAEFGYLHISNDGELNVKGNADKKVWYNNSDYSFYSGEIIINGVANFNATDVLALYTKVSCDNGTSNPGTLNIKNDAYYEAERHNGAIDGTNFILYKTGVANVDETSELYIGEYTSIATDAVMNIGGTATALGTITNNGTINLTTVDATLTAQEGLEVNSTVEDYEVDYADGKYSMVKAPEVELFDVYGMNLDLESSIKANFYILASHFKGTDYYAKIVHSSATGDIERIVNFADWEDNGSYKQISYTDLAAKNMADTVTVSIFDGDDNKVSVDYVRSIKDYAEGYIRDYAGTDDKWVTPFVDMLNYGAEAQKYFSYNTENLANAGIGDYQQYATQSDVELENDVEKYGPVHGANLDLENKIVYNGYFSGVTEDMTAEFSYTDHLGNEVSHPATLVPNGSYHQVTVDTLVIADANQPVTITVKDSNGVVHAYRKQSINGYLHSTMDDIYFIPLAKAMAKFTKSAHTALH